MDTPIQKQSLSEQVYARLRDRILSRSWPEGTELPSERQLAETFGVNRGAVREAIKRLQQASLVRVRHGGATQVENFERTGGLELLPSLLVNAQGQLNTELAQGIVAVRKVLAPLVASQAAQHASADLHPRLEAVLERMRACLAEADMAVRLPKLQQLAFDYWEAVVQHSGNVVFKLAFNSMNQTYRAAWGALTHVMAAEFSDVATLHQLALAIKAGEHRRCEVLARQHVELGSRALERAFSVIKTNEH
ncbi:FadR/GntR family transcriptional regulator [Limnobacter sp.]|uniref:FadR/GntR family transcriptional regulator n=1 Tax=Limnobacter sp. TaxID=2003368 RepID=UPI0035131BF4